METTETTERGDTMDTDDLAEIWSEEFAYDTFVAETDGADMSAESNGWSYKAPSFDAWMESYRSADAFAAWLAAK